MKPASVCFSVQFDGGFARALVNLHRCPCVPETYFDTPPLIRNSVGPIRIATLKIFS